MKRFFFFFLALAVLMGSITCIADDDDAVVSIDDEEIDVEEDENDLMVEEIEVPVEEVDLFLGEDMQEEIDLVEEGNSPLVLPEDTDLLPYTDYNTGEGPCEEESELNSAKEVMSNEATSPVTQPVGNGFYLPMESIRKSDDKAGFIPGKRWSTSSYSHLACDFISARGNYNETIYPIFTGKVIEIGYNSGSGNYIRIEHDAFGIKFYSQYQHLREKPSVSGEVFAGTTPIGVEGNTGAVVGNPGNHLHLIVWSLDTIPWTPPIENYKEIDPDLGGQPIEFNAYNRDDIYIGKYNEYIYYPFIYTKNVNGKYIKLYNPERILDGTYKPGDERKKVESITLNKNSINLNFDKGESFQLVAAILPEDAANKSVLWSTDKPEVATVTEGGLVQPVGAGDAVITCKAQDGSGASASCTIKVTKLELNAKELDMYIGQTYTLKGTIGKTKVSCSFKSSNSKVVSVDKKGKITAKNVKKTTKVTITATAPKKQGTATCIVTVHPKPTKLTIKQGKAKTLNIGDTLDLTAVFTPKDALGKVIWSTSHKKVATVSSSGKVKAVGEGVTTIEAEVTGAGDGSATIKITVVDPKKPTGIKISAPSKTVYMGETLKLTTTLSPKTAESTITWKSSNTKIAKVSKKGVVTPVKAGTATITATASKKSPKGKVVSATIKISVKKSTAASSISVSTKEKTLHVGDQWQLDYKIKPEGAKASLTFNSSDETVATVNENGVITANAEGSATITVVTQNNKKASCKVTVLAEASGLQLDKESLSLNVGDTYQLTCFVSHGLSGSVTFSSSNAAVATVDANALITAVGVGEATITASMDNGAIATCNVTVVESEEEHPVVGDFVIDNGIVVGYTGEGGDVVIPEKDGNNNPVVGIGKNAFMDNERIITIIIPDSVTCIDEYAFSKCTNLKSVRMPKFITKIGTGTFKECENLKDITIPNGLTELEAGTFYRCLALTDIVIPTGVSSIGSDAFFQCGLKSVVIPDTVTEIGPGAFYACDLVSVNIPNGVKTINIGVFEFCGSLTSVNIPESVTSIGCCAFYYCDHLTDIVIPNGVTRIEDRAFALCKRLRSVNIPESVTIIEKSAFSDCYSLSSVNIPNGITRIESCTFFGCAFSDISIPTGVTYIGSSAFNGCGNLTSLDIPSGVTYIGSMAFNGCSKLTSLRIPNGVTTINNETFSGCSSLKQIEVPNGITSIGEQAFDGCGALEYFTVPDSVTSIGMWAFRFCRNLIITVPSRFKDVTGKPFLYCKQVIYV